MTNPLFEYDILGARRSHSAMRVLIVDNNNDGASIAALLKQCGHEAGTVGSGELALRKAPEFKPDVLFIDVASPSLDGLTIARRLRDIPPFSSTPLVAVTDDDHFSQAAAEGFDDFLCKPYSLADVRATMARIGAKLASSRERVDRSREVATRSRALNEESRRGLEQYRQQRQINRAGETNRVFFLACDPAFHQLVSAQMPSGRVSTVACGSLEDFLTGRDSAPVAGNQCLVLDATTGQIEGLSVFFELNQRRWTLPVVAIVAGGDVGSAVQFMRAGACDVIEKPLAQSQLLPAVWRALASSGSGDNESRCDVHGLSADEGRLLELTASGALTKQIARELGVSLRTVQLRRAALRKKLGARTGADLIRVAVRRGLC